MVFRALHVRMFFALFPALLAASPAFAGEGGETVLSAVERAPGVTTVIGQSMEMYLGREMRVFGNAEIHKDGDYIKGERIFLNSVNDEIHAVGNVRVKQGDTLADGAELRMKLEDRLGHMDKPVFRLNTQSDLPGRGDAEKIFFEGPNRERLEDARYTTCPAGNDDWYLKASDLEIDHHAGSATATHASIQFMGLPIAYSPWMSFPFSTERKSGLLTPTFGTTTRNGLELSIPYYWNISPNMDATFTPRYLGKRGLQMGVEHRHLGENHAGTSYGEYLSGDNQTGENRHYFNLDHTLNFAEGWSSSVQYEKASDGQYFTDMSTKVISTSRVNLPQQASVRYDGGNWHFRGLAQRYQTLDKVSFPYQRLPQLSFYGTESLDWADLSLSSEFVRFDRHNDAPVIVTGNRTTLYPSLSFPFTRSYGYVTPKIGVHYTRYDLSDAGNLYDSETRTAPIFSLDSGLYFDREMRVVKNRYTHTLEPRLFYVYVPEKDQSRIPVFDTGLSDLNLSTIFSENQFSGGDRINDANQITLALTSRMIDQKTGTQRLAATIGERFYFSDQRVVLPGGAPRTSSRSDILAALNLQLTNFWYADLNYQYNTQDDNTVRSNLSARYQPEPGKVLNLGYRYTVDSLEQIDISSQWPIAPRWYGLGRLNYSLRDNPPTDVRGPIEYIAGLEYDAGCWMGRFLLQRLATATVTSAARSNYAFFFQLELNGLSKIGSNPLELIKRNITGYTETSKIPDFAP